MYENITNLYSTRHRENFVNFTVEIFEINHIMRGYNSASVIKFVL